MAAVGCNCGKKSAISSRETFKLVTPNGQVKVYSTEAEAKRAQSRLGGNVSAQK